VVLWEVTVGRRLFRRHSDAATVLAVMRDTIPLPSRVREDYPELLEAIVMRALERDPARRFQTALEFARALESFLSQSGLPAGAGDVGEFMQTLFADQIAMRDEVLRAGARLAPLEELVAVWQGSAPTPPPAAAPPTTSTKCSPPRPSPPPRGEHELSDESEAIPLTRAADDGPRTVYVASKSSRRSEGGSLGALFGAALAVVTLALVYLVLRPPADAGAPRGRGDPRGPRAPAGPAGGDDPRGARSLADARAAAGGRAVARPAAADADAPTATLDHGAGRDVAARGDPAVPPGVPLVHLHPRGGRLRR
jgi:hypothetical protein